MKSRKEYIVLAVVVIVLILYLFLRHSDRTRYELPEINSLDKAEISRIAINTPDEEIRLEKQEDRWVLMPQGHPADDQKMNKMLDTLDDLALTALVSESESYSRYQLADDEKILVKAWSNEQLVRALAIGKAAPSHRHTFVKLGDDPNVYHARNNFRSRFNQSAARLRDKTVMRFKAADIKKIEIRQADKRRLISRSRHPGPSDEVSDTGSEDKALLWQDADGNTVAAADVEELLDNLSDLQCREFIAEDRKSEFTDPIYNITLSGKKDHTLSIFASPTEADETYPATSAQTQTPFYLSAHLANTIMEAIDAQRMDEE